QALVRRIARATPEGRVLRGAGAALFTARERLAGARPPRARSQEETDEAGRRSLLSGSQGQTLHVDIHPTRPIRASRCVLFSFSWARPRHERAGPPACRASTRARPHSERSALRAPN